jgi:hypothetical protein
MTGLLRVLGARRRRVAVMCDVDIEKTAESLHAHAVPDAPIGPGDSVLVHDIPTEIAFGQHIQCRCPATLTRALPGERLWTEIVSLLELTELYEVGFLPKEAAS